MPIFDIICSICTEIFQNSDDIHSTDCGHLFHLPCFDDWQRKERSCPQCRNMYPTTYKLHLGFDEFETKSESREDLQTKIQSSAEKLERLSLQIKEFERNFVQLQKQLTDAEEEKKVLQEKVNRLASTENDFLLLQEQYTETLDTIKQLEDRITELHIVKECNKLDLKDVENDQLPSNLDDGNISISYSELNEEIKVNEMKLDILTKELEKEISKSASLTIEKIKLQSYINNFHPKEKRENVVLKPNEKNSKAKKTKANKKSLQQNPHGSMNENGTSVFITGIPLGHVTLPLENVVLNLASKMDVSVSRKDLVKVTTVNNDVEMSSTVQLLVEFKSSEIKYIFLCNQESLRNNTTTETIVIEELMNDELRALFLYAKGKLQNSRLNYLFIKNNKIYAKSFESDSEIVQIQSKSQVDNLQKKCVYNQILQLTENLSFN